MMGRITYNIVFGIVAFIITFITALSENVWLISLVRAVFAFILFFVVVFPVRWFFSLIVGKGQAAALQAEKAETVTDAATGTHVDLVTPDTTDELDGPTESEHTGETFTPLVVPRVERPQFENDAAGIANVVRRLTDE